MELDQVVQLVDLIGVPGALLLGVVIVGMKAIRGANSVGSELSTHIDAVRKELEELKHDMAALDQKRSLGFDKVAKALEAIRRDFHDYQLLMERRLTKLESRHDHVREG